MYIVDGIVAQHPVMNRGVATTPNFENEYPTIAAVLATATQKNVMLIVTSRRLRRYRQRERYAKTMSTANRKACERSIFISKSLHK